VDRVCPLGLRALVAWHLHPVVHSNPLDHQHPVLDLDLAPGLDVVGVPLNFDLTRLQRAGKGARQSAGGRGHHVVERGGLGRELLGVHAVVLGHLGMHSEAHRLGGGGNVGQALRATKPIDSDV
jgi:hypothetical protein